MGVVAVLSVAVGAASLVAQRSAQRRSLRAQERAQNIRTASGQIQNRAERRQAARAARIRRARLVSSSETSGGTGGSGLTGALGALRSNLDSSFANQRSQEFGAQGISSALQESANQRARISNLQGLTRLTIGALDTFEDDINAALSG